MSKDVEIEVYRALRTSQEKYAYFLLTAAGAAIAFSVTQTNDDELTFLHIPLAIAVAFWAFSFYFGCRGITLTNATLFANGELIKVQSGIYPGVGSHPQAIAVVSEDIRGTIAKNSEGTNNLVKLQFRLSLFGAAFFVAWHVLEMYSRR